MAVKTRIGLDIGSTGVRAAEVTRGKQGVALTALTTSDLPAGAVLGGVVQDEDAVISALRGMWPGRRPRPREVVLGVTHRQVVVREISMSNLPDDQLRAALPFQARQVLPMAVEQSLLDFHRLREHGSGSTVQGLLIAVPRDPVLAMVRVTERAGLRVRGVDLASFAVLRSASRLDSTVEALVNIGARVTSVVVHCDGEPLIVRAIPRGGEEITESIARRLSVESPRAEVLKREATGAGVGEAIEEALRPLVNEIRSSLAYLTASERHSRVERLALSGGGALLPRLDEVLAEQLGVRVVPADPLVRVGVVTGGGESPSHGRLLADAGTNPSVAAVAIGLALEAPR